MASATDEQMLEWIKIRQRGADPEEVPQLERIKARAEEHIQDQEEDDDA